MQVSGNVRVDVQPVVRRASEPKPPPVREAAAEAAPVSLSPEAAEVQASHEAHAADGGADGCPYCTPSEDTSEATKPKDLQAPKSGDAQALKPGELTEDEQAQVKELKARDAEVRTHEEAHMAAAGSLANGGPKYEFQNGPDGKRYAVGGHVNIDTSKGRTPEETLAKATQIRRAALAPAEPSGQDRRVAAKASRMAAEARQEIRQASLGEGEEANDAASANAKTDAEVAAAFDSAAALSSSGTAGVDSPRASARQALRAYGAG